MNRFERAILAVAPGMAARRAKARAQALGNEARAQFLDEWGGGGYDAGRSNRKALQEDHPDVDSPRTAHHPTMWTTRKRSRNLIRNSAVAAGAVRGLRAGVHGGGLAVRPALDREALGIGEEEAEAFEAGARMIFDAWAASEGGADLRGEMSFSGLQHLVLSEVYGGGDVLWVYRMRRTGGVLRSAVQLYEPERISNPIGLMDRTRLSAGVELNDDGMVLAYHISRHHPGEQVTHGGHVREKARNGIGERVARLVFHPDRVGQVRGIPVLAPVYLLIKELTDYTDTEVRRALTQALLTAFVYSETPPGAVEMTENVERIASRYSPLAGTPAAEDPDADPEAQERAEGSDYRLGSGTVVELGDDEKVTLPSPTSPNRGFGAFVEVVERYIGMAFGIPREVLVKEFRASFSASRGALQEAYRRFRTDRTWLVDQFCQPLYDLVIGEAVMRGLLDAPGFFTDPVMRAEWCRAEWTGDAPPILDPIKEAKGAEERVQGGFSTRSRESRELTGTDFRRNVAKLAEEEQMLADAMKNRSIEEPGE